MERPVTVNEFQMERPVTVNDCLPKTRSVPGTTYFPADAERREELPSLLCFFIRYYILK